MDPEPKGFGSSRRSGTHGRSGTREGSGASVVEPEGSWIQSVGLRDGTEPKVYRLEGGEDGGGLEIWDLEWIWNQERNWNQGSGA